MALRVTPAVRNAAVNAVTALADAGTGPGLIRVYTGAQPATASTAPTGTLLVTFTLADPAYDAAVSGVAELDTTPDIAAVAAADGTAGWARMSDSDGNAIYDDVCRTDGTSAFTLNTLVIANGQTVTLTSGTFSVPSGE